MYGVRREEDRAEEDQAKVASQDNGGQSTLVEEQTDKDEKNHRDWNEF